MSAHDTYEAAIKSAAATKAAAIAAAETTRQLASDQRAGGTAKLVALNAAEQVFQSALMVARDTLRTAGDFTGAF
jgi:hypothetical protein